MTVDDLQALIAEVTADIGGRPLDAALARLLNQRFPPEGDWFRQIESVCQEAIDDGWMCQREAGGIRYGRVIKPGPATHGFSVDVVLMNNVTGPRHRHPLGEIDLIMPADAAAQFHGHGAGWYVYGPETMHAPTVTGGEAMVLYLLPGGEIDFPKG